jgi:hypothetical protein
MDTSSKPLEVVLTKLEDRFSLKFDYDDDLRKLIKSQEKSYFDRDFKEWSLPNTSRKIISEYLTKRKAKITLKKRENEAKIEINEDSFSLSFRQYADIWLPYRRIEGANYDKISSKLIYPRNALSKVK